MVRRKKGVRVLVCVLRWQGIREGTVEDDVWDIVDSELVLSERAQHVPAISQPLLYPPQMTLKGVLHCPVDSNDCFNVRL
jgi:hypothetical protein